jgi:hypothetical protein
MYSKELKERLEEESTRAIPRFAFSISFAPVFDFCLAFLFFVYTL